MSDAHLIAEDRHRTDAVLAALAGRSAESRALLTGIEHLERLGLDRVVLDGLAVTRAALLDTMRETRRCARAWRARRDVLAGLLAGDPAAGPQALMECVAACDAACRALERRTRELRVAERCVALRAAIADPRSAGATLEALGAALAA